MALVLADRVQQTGTASGTTSFTLSGSVTGFQSFTVIGNGNTTYYSATDASGNWEVGIGTYATGGTLTRTTILSSSNAGAAVTFSGTVNVFVTQPSGQTVISSNNAGTSGYVLTSNGTGVSPTWQQSSFSGGTTGLTPATATTGAVTLGGTLNVANGGTGVTTSTGSGAVVLGTSPSLTTPNLGTPSAVNLSNATSLPRSALPSGSVLKVQQFTDSGSSTTSGTVVNLNGSYFSYTPVSTNSTLYFMVSFYCYQTPTSGYGASTYGYYQIGEVLGGTPTAFSNVGYIWCYQYSTTYTQSNAQTGVAVGKRTNSSLSTRQFDLMGATTDANVAFNGYSITMTITEVAN
jgi:hypothetical protein